MRFTASRSRRDYPELRRRLLTPLAEVHGLDYNHEALEPGDSPAQLAYGLLSAGASVPLSLINDDEFPSGSRKLCKHGSKRVRQLIGNQGSRDAALLGAHSIGVMFEELCMREGEVASAEAHAAMRSLLDQFYPGVDLVLLDSLRVEFRTFETHAVRDDIEAFAETGTGYHRAIMEGRDPDADAELVQIQEMYATSFLQGWTMLNALRLTVGDAEFETMLPDLIRPGSLDPEILVWTAALRSDFTHWGGRWADVFDRLPA